MATARMKGKGKGIASKHQKYEGYEVISRPQPEVKIIKCIGFQKFRYCGENRPGKKYQDKDFLTLALCQLSGKNVRVQIVCFDAERQNEIHPNGLVGRDCEHGVYSKVFPISKNTQIVRIPYLRTERILTKKTHKEEKSKMSTVFEERAEILPFPYSHQCHAQSKLTHKFDTTRVCFGIICTIEGEDAHPLFCLSNVVQNASEKTTLNIMKLSTQYVSAQEGGEIDIFTTEDGPPITAGKCMVKVVVKDQERTAWESPQSTPAQNEILYKRVVSYRVPAFGPNPATDTPVLASVELSCVQSGQTCIAEFVYQPGADSARRLATIHSNKPLRKRPYVPDPTDDVQPNGADSIKRRVKEKVNKNRQNIADPGAEEYKIEPMDSHLPVTVTCPLNANTAAAAASVQDGVPLHQQDDLVLAKDLLTGEVVYLRTQQGPSSDVVMYVHDAQQALSSGGDLTSLTLLSDAPRAVSVPTSEWNTATTGVPNVANSNIRVLETPRRPSSDRVGSSSSGGPTTRRKLKVFSPWVVDEPQNPQLAKEQPSITYVKVNDQLKREPAEMGPPILQKRVSINSDSVPGVSNNLPSGTLVSLSSANNLLSLNSLFASGVLEGVRFDDTGTLLSSSVFEMVQPYIDKMDATKDA
ncbi:uncharacterized protein [Littorina saxatilis]